jgi:pimeloyl-ACP methyl ester carboxylesterase
LQEGISLTRNQIRKQQYIISQRIRELSPLIFSSDVRKNPTPEYQRALEEAQLLHQQMEELDAKMLNSRDEDEPQEETYIPERVTGKIPLLLLLHGAGWTGGSQVEIWRPIAEREKIVLLAPTSLRANRDWSDRQDYQTLESRFDHVVSTMPVDSSRIYLVGHSIGGAQALRMGRMKPDQIAALALHSPSMDQPVLHGGFPQSSRRVPIRVWAGSDYESDSNRHWAELLQFNFQQHTEHNVDVDVKLLDNHAHKDYNTREGLLDEMWSFLKDKSLLQSSESSTSAPQTG